MIIHTDTLTHADFADAVHYASRVSGGEVWTDREDVRGSRSRARAFDVTLVADGTVSRRRPNSGRCGATTDDAYAATWDQWGYFLAHLFVTDPRAVAGPYKGSDDFHARTANAYRIAVGTPRR